MKTWIALLRGVNVGGSNTLPMRDLVATFERARLRAVRTHIQSGNVVFQSSKAAARLLENQIAGLISRRCGFEPGVIVLSARDLSGAISANPFAKAAVDNPKALHLCFLSKLPTKPDFDALTRLKAGREDFLLRGKIFYLLTPDGFGNSRLAARLEHFLGVGATCRNWRTVNQLLKMSDEIV